ncbi:unnamed protein product [Caenorhabditis bovis]|uniref:Bromodomain adjacent to zinc finger domain protein 2B n=1 Tax=Caenorhabditis bovis TaxID=2654633 RepID=A0A8S1EL97_9PELO|nr:unnamed protein product [Caenorhabditis bovis]
MSRDAVIIIILFFQKYVVKKSGEEARSRPREDWRRAQNGNANQLAQMAAAMSQLNSLANSSLRAASSQQQAQQPVTITPEAMMFWQNMMQAQMLQQMAAAAKQPNMEEMLKKMMQKAMAASNKGAATKTSKSKEPGEVVKQQQQQQQQPSTSTASTSSGAAKNTIDAAMWQLVAAQMIQHQQLQNEQTKKLREAQKQKEESIKATKQQEQIIKMLIQQQVMQKQKAMEEAVDSTDAAKSKKVAMMAEINVRLALQLGWKRQTCVRTITASGVRGDVSYYAPCGKKLSTYTEVQRYLTKNDIKFLNRDNFSFTSKLIVGEFIVPKTKESSDGDDASKEFVVMSEEEVNKELARLIALKAPPKLVMATNNAASSSGVSPSSSSTEAAREEQSRAASPEEILDNLNDDYIDETVVTTFGPNGEEHKSREPGDDLLVHEIRPLPDLPRIGNQCLDSVGFGDAVMIHEFLHNFYAALQIDLSQIPPLEVLCAGLAGDEKHADAVLHLSQKLFCLALEHPGMASTPRSETRFGQGAGELGIDRDNFSEVLRLFLAGKDKKGQKLSELLDATIYEKLRGEEKAAILAYLCDELLASPNVIREIDRNLDEMGRLRGEKWLREGKARTLKTMQQKKQNAGSSAQPNVDGSDSDGSRPTTPAQAHAHSTTPQKHQVPTAGLAKKFTPGLGQCEVLTAEEEAMSVEEMESCIAELHAEAQQINRKIHETSLRVRSFPFGLDRFHRQYWLLAHTPTVLIESIESAARNNPACNVFEVCAKDPAPLEAPKDSTIRIDEDVLACVEDLVDTIILNRAKADKKQRRRYRRIDNHMKRGWWTLDSKESIEHLKTSLHGRGMRERCLHRLLCKPWFLNDIKLGKITLEPVESKLQHEVLDRQSLKRIDEAIEKLRRRMRMSDVVIPEYSDNGKGKPTVTPTHMALAQVVRDDIAWKTYDDENERDVDLEEAQVRSRIVETAKWVVPKFWRPAFASRIGDDGVEKEPEKMAEWRRYVLEEASTTSQLMVGLQVLEAMIAWERTPREALCQICKSMDGDEMLVCDGCDNGCHMECFRPAMTKVPSGDWYCPRCREQRTGRNLCMFCCKENGTLITCQRCAYHMHYDCTVEEKSAKEHYDPEKFICPHCVDVKTIRFAKRVMFRDESEEREIEEAEGEHQQQQLQLQQQMESNKPLLRSNATTPTSSTTNVVNGSSSSGEKRVAVKRKINEPVQLHLPLEMNHDLCKAMLDELEAQPFVGPFLEPVDLKAVPGYKQIIQKPIDLSMIRSKNESYAYETPDEFASDIELMLFNCRTFNVDESAVGQAGIQMKKFFTKRWRQLKYNYSKRFKRLQKYR